jgi:hypothetical protein
MTIAPDTIDRGHPAAPSDSKTKGHPRIGVPILAPLSLGCYLIGYDTIYTSSAWYKVTENQTGGHPAAPLGGKAAGPRVEIPFAGALVGIQAPAMLGEYDVYFNNLKIGSSDRYGAYHTCMSRLPFKDSTQTWPMTSVSNKYRIFNMYCDYIRLPGKLEIEFKAARLADLMLCYLTAGEPLDTHTTYKDGQLTALITLQHRNKIYRCETKHSIGQTCMSCYLCIYPNGEENSGGCSARAMVS